MSLVNTTDATEEDLEVLRSQLGRVPAESLKQYRRALRVRSAHCRGYQLLACPMGLLSPRPTT